MPRCFSNSRCVSSPPAVLISALTRSVLIAIVSPLTGVVSVLTAPVVAAEAGVPLEALACGRSDLAASAALAGPFAC